MFLFGPPNVMDLWKKGDVPGLIKATKYKKDPKVQVEAVKVLLKMLPNISPAGVEMVDKEKARLFPLALTLLRQPRERNDAAAGMNKLGWIPEDNVDHTLFCIGADRWNDLTGLDGESAKALLSVAFDRININPTRVGAIESLGRCKVTEAIPDLTAILMDDMKEQDSIRKAAAKALISIDPAAGESNPFIKFCLVPETSASKEAEALDALFATLQTVPTLTKPEAEAQFADARRSWGSIGASVGGVEVVRPVILKNLELIRRQVGSRFDGYSISVVIYARAAQINVFHGKSFTPIRVWRVGDDYWATGNVSFLLK